MSPLPEWSRGALENNLLCLFVSELAGAALEEQRSATRNQVGKLKLRERC